MEWIARQVATDRNVNLWQTARLFGLLNIALTDGYVATFAKKYDLLFWRPITAIPAGREGRERRDGRGPDLGSAVDHTTRS